MKTATTGDLAYLKKLRSKQVEGGPTWQSLDRLVSELEEPARVRSRAARELVREVLDLEDQSAAADGARWQIEMPEIILPGETWERLVTLALGAS